MNRFNVYFIMDEDFESSIDLFKQNKEYKLVDANSYNKSIDIVAKHPRQSESEAKKQIKGLLYSVDITAFRFTPGQGPMQESKKSKVKTIIERIVERVIAKKLTEAKDNSITSPTAKAYFMYLKSLDKARLLNIAKSYHRIDSMDKGTPKMDLVYDILASEHGNKWFEKTIRLPEYAKKFLKETFNPKRILKESTELKSDFSNLDQYIIMNFDEIQKNMEVYGFHPEDIESMDNYYDIAHLLGVDTQLIKDADLYYITQMAHGIINDINDEERY